MSAGWSSTVPRLCAALLGKPLLCIVTKYGTVCLEVLTRLIFKNWDKMVFFETSETFCSCKQHGYLSYLTFETENSGF